MCVCYVASVLVLCTVMCAARCMLFL